MVQFKISGILGFMKYNSAVERPWCFSLTAVLILCSEAVIICFSRHFDFSFVSLFVLIS